MLRLAVAVCLLATALLADTGPTVAPVRIALEDVGLERALWGREQNEEMQAPSDAILARQLFGSDAAPSDVFSRAAAQARSLPRSGGGWQFVGPATVGGRLLDVVVDPAQADTIYVAAASGGVWRSTDAGTTFTPAWPDDLTQAIGALAITPSGVLFAGTGEAGPGGGSLTYGGTGVYRSTDRGRTWQHVGLPDSARIGRIVVDPTDERRLFVAAGGPLYRPGGERGLYLSEDGGDSWTRVLEGANATTGAVDVAVDPRNPQRVFAAMWDLLREPDLRRYEGPGSGLFRSEDGGRTWEPVDRQRFGPGNPALSRIGVTIAPGDPSRVYAILTGPIGYHAGLYRSTDGGETFAPSTTDPSLILASSSYGWWFGRVFVDPRDADHVFVAGVNFPESTDGGVTWSDVPGIHVDQHGMAWDPKVPGRVYLANDGGLYRSENDGGGFLFAEHQPWHQAYGLDVSEQDPSRITAGLQDNGAVRSYPDGWNGIIGGDGQRTLINPKDQDIVFACAQYGACSRSTDGGNETEPFDERVVSTRKNWFTPIELDPADPSTLYTGGELLSRSTDDGQTWVVISPDLSSGPGRTTNPDYTNFGTITTMAPAPRETGTIYAGTDDGNLWYTHSGGGLTPGAWTKASDPDLPRAWVTRVEVDPRDPKVAYVTYSGFRTADEAAYVLLTRDGGASWENITGDLPKVPLNDVNVIADLLFVASDLGVFLSRDGGARWERAGTGLPIAPAFELRHHAPTGALYVATFGRGIYRVALADLDRAPAAPATPAPTPAAHKRLRLRISGCIRRGRATLRLRAPKGVRLKSARLKVRGARAIGLRGRALRRPVRLRGLRRRAVVTVTARTADGRTLVARRTLRRCRVR